MIFLRAELLWLFVLWAPLAFWLVRQKSVHQSWTTVIDSQLLSAFIQPQKTQRSLQPWLLPIALALCIIAASGPALQQPQTEITSQGNLIVVLDNSLSMAATDTQPSRIERAKRMIVDWANSGIYQQTGVIVYSASAHWLTPFTHDARTLQLQLEPVTPFLMPEFGNHPERAFALLNNRLPELPNAPLHLLWLTDDIPNDKIPLISQTLPNFASAFVVPVGGTSATPIPLPNNQGFLTTQGNNVVMVATDHNKISTAASRLGMRTTELNSQPNTLPQGELARLSIDQTSYQEVGYWLMVPIMLWLFFYLAKHAHNTAGIIVVLVATTFTAPKADAESIWDQLLLNTEQRAYKALSSGQIDRALSLSQRSEVLGEALFQLQEYEQAAQAFALQNTAAAWFNQGNALAHNQQFEQAIAAYEQAIKLANHQGAQTNKELIENFLQQLQDSEEPSSAEQEQSESSSEDTQQGAPQNNEAAESTENQEQHTDMEPQNNNESNNETNNEHPEFMDSNEEPSISESEQNATDNMNRDDIREQQIIDALLNRVQTEPGRVIQRKFNHQFQQNPVDSEGTPW